MTDQRRVFLIRLLIALAVLRFGVYPWIENQSERRDELSVLTNRLDRAEGVVENRIAIEAAAKALTKTAATTSERFTYADTTDRLRLDTQTRLTEIVRANGLGVSLFDWLIEGDTDPAVFERDGFSFARLRIEFAGPPRQIAMAQNDIEGNFPGLLVRRASLNFRDITTNIDSGIATASIIADVYYKLGSPAAKAGNAASVQAESVAEQPRPVPREAPGFSTVAPGPLPSPAPTMRAIPGDIPPGTVPIPRPPPKGIQPKMIPKGIAPPLSDDEEAV